MNFMNKKEKNVGNTRFIIFLKNDENILVFHQKENEYLIGIDKNRIIHIFLHGKHVDNTWLKTHICGKLENSCF